MNLEPNIRKIIEAAVLAPSGENAQPWRFRVSDQTIELYNNPTSDQSPYNWHQFASYVSTGTALENMLIAARALGYEARMIMFPDHSNQNFIAQLELATSQVAVEPLYDYISKRVTNRKPYQNIQLPEAQLERLVSVPREIGSRCRIMFTQDNPEKTILGRAGSTNEEVMMTNRYIHDFFFNHVTWTKAEDAKKKVGFYIETLELPKPAQFAFKLFSRWPLMRLFIKLGVPAAIGKQNGLVNASSSAIGILTVPALTPADFVMAGRTFERLWLRVTEAGLSLQPLTGVLFFMLSIRAGETDKFSADQVIKIKKAYQDIAKIFNVPNTETITLMFRIGQSDQPTAQATKFTVEDVMV